MAGIRRSRLAVLILLSIWPAAVAQPGTPEGAPAPGPRSDVYETGVVAQVNREVVTRGQVWARLRGSLAGADEATRQAMFDAALVQIVRDLLLDQATGKLQLRIDERYIRGRIESDKEELGGEQNYRAFLLEQGTTEQEHVNTLMRQSERTFLLRARAGIDRGLGPDLRPEFDVVPTAQEVRDYYKKHLKTEFSNPAEREIWFLAVTRSSTARRLADGTVEPGTAEKALALVERLRDDLLTGADFGTLAVEHSPASAAERGYFGWQVRETSSLAGEVLEWAFDPARREGELSPPLPFGGSPPRGYILVRVSGMREARLVPFQEAQAGIALKIRNQRTEAAVALVEARLVEDAYIWPPRLKTLLGARLREKARAVPAR